MRIHKKYGSGYAGKDGEERDNFVLVVGLANDAPDPSRHGQPQFLSNAPDTPAHNLEGANWDCRDDDVGRLHDTKQCERTSRGKADVDNQTYA